MLPTARRGRVRSRSWHRVSPGLHYADRGRPLDAWQLALPEDGRFTHLTAAQLWGLWDPMLPAGLPVVAAVGAGATRPQRAGLRVIRIDPWAPPTTIDGLRVDSVLDTLLACARDLALLDLVVLVDSALHAELCTLEELRALASTRRKGTPRLREALELADGRSESAFETLLRVLLVIAGYDVEPQKRLFDATRTEVARLDLWFVGTVCAAEYDGADHLPREQQDKDEARHRRIVGLNWVRRGYTSRDVLNRAAGILRDAQLVTSRAPREGALAEWNQLLAESSYTASGRSQLARRVRFGGSGKRSVNGDRQSA